VEIEWEKPIETHLFEECEDVNNGRRGLSSEACCWKKKKIWVMISRNPC